MSGATGIVGVILAGGRSRRMGLDKAFLTLGGETLLARTIARASPQTGELLINANGDPARFAGFGLTVIPDSIGGFLGPVAGICAGLEWLRAHRPDAQWLASFACDTPFFPPDLATHLIEKAQSANALVAVAASGGRYHPVFAVWRSDLPATAQSVLNDQALRKMGDFVALFPNTSVDFPTGAIDPFFNINTPDDLARAENFLAKK